MPAYYNEIDPYAAQWLRNLIDAGHIAPGVVDERDIRDVVPTELAGYTQCHFFAGIGGWSLALRLAGWPDDKPVWTGSCPCQPFSAAGEGKGFADERHLWPDWYWLIRQCRPRKVLGEQVASSDALDWIDLVRADLESAAYAFGALDLCAAGVGAPHIRQRLYFVAESECWAAERHGLQMGTASRGMQGEASERQRIRAHIGDGSHPNILGDAGHGERGRRNGLGYAGSEPASPPSQGESPGAERLGTLSNVADAGAVRAEQPGPTNGFWRAADWLLCRDGKWRPVEPGTFPLAHGIPGRVGRLRAYGNAIVPQIAAEFIKATY